MHVREDGGGPSGAHDSGDKETNSDHLIPGAGLVSGPFLAESLFHSTLEFSEHLALTLWLLPSLLRYYHHSQD